MECIPTADDVVLVVTACCCRCRPRTLALNPAATNTAASRAQPHAATIAPAHSAPSHALPHCGTGAHLLTMRQRTEA